MKRKIALITGSRSDYGLLYWLMKEIQTDPSLDLQIVATGMHLSADFGMTVNQIVEDGFLVSARVEVLDKSDTSLGIAHAIGRGVSGCAEALEKLRPDLVVVLGDRFEILAAAQAALALNLPIAHIHGGELTEGAFDDAIRHAITKMSHLHFVATDEYRKRVIQLGESPGRVMNFGAIGLDHAHRTRLLDRKELEASLGFALGRVNFLVTYHPVTLEREGPTRALNALFSTLEEFPEARIIFTKSNADPGGRLIGSRVDQFVSKHSHRATAFTVLGQQRYLSLLKLADVVIGNSSSGIIEAPILKIPTVNLGDRQKGRMRATSVIDCSEDAPSIRQAIQKALSPDFRGTLQNLKSPYGGEGHTSPRIKEVLRSIPLENLIHKKFHDQEAGS